MAFAPDYITYVTQSLPDPNPLPNAQSLGSLGTTGLATIVSSGLEPSASFSVANTLSSLYLGHLTIGNPVGAVSDIALNLHGSLSMQGRVSIFNSDFYLFQGSLSATTLSQYIVKANKVVLEQTLSNQTTTFDLNFSQIKIGVGSVFPPDPTKLLTNTIELDASQEISLTSRQNIEIGANNNLNLYAANPNGSVGISGAIGQFVFSDTLRLSSQNEFRMRAKKYRMYAYNSSLTNFDAEMRVAGWKTIIGAEKIEPLPTSLEDLLYPPEDWTFSISLGAIDSIAINSFARMSLKSTIMNIGGIIPSLANPAITASLTLKSAGNIVIDSTVINSKSLGTYSIESLGSMNVNVAGSYNTDVAGEYNLGVLGAAGFEVAGEFNLLSGEMTLEAGEINIASLTALTIETVLDFNVVSGGFASFEVSDFNVAAGVASFETGAMSLNGGALEMAFATMFAQIGVVTLAIDPLGLIPGFYASSPVFFFGSLELFMDFSIWTALGLVDTRVLAGAINMQVLAGYFSAGVTFGDIDLIIGDLGLGAGYISIGGSANLDTVGIRIATVISPSITPSLPGHVYIYGNDVIELIGDDQANLYCMDGHISIGQYDNESIGIRIGTELSTSVMPKTKNWLQMYGDEVVKIFTKQDPLVHADIYIWASHAAFPESLEAGTVYLAPHVDIAGDCQVHGTLTAAELDVGTIVIDDLALDNLTVRETLTVQGEATFEDPVEIDSTLDVSGTVTFTTPLAIGSGGTGQSTQEAAFDALSPATSTGDMIIYSGGHNVRLPIGTPGQVLTVSDTNIPQWTNSPSFVSTTTTDASLTYVITFTPTAQQILSLDVTLQAANADMSRSCSGRLYGYVTVDSNGLITPGDNLIKDFIAAANNTSDFTLVPYAQPQTNSLPDPLTTTSGSQTITVFDITNPYTVGDPMIFFSTSTSNLNGISSANLRRFAYTVNAVGLNFYEVSLAGKTVSLGSTPLSTTAGSSVLTITLASHNLAVSDGVILSGLTTVGGLSTSQINASFPVTTINTPTSSNFQITLPLTTLGASPIATTNGSAVITLTQAAHGFTTGQGVTISGAVDTGGILAANINGNRVVTVLSPSSYEVTAGSVASSTTTGGGSGVTIRQYAVTSGTGGGSAGTVEFYATSSGAAGGTVSTASQGLSIVVQGEASTTYTWNVYYQTFLNTIP